MDKGTEVVRIGIADVFFTKLGVETGSLVIFTLTFGGSAAEAYDGRTVVLEPWGLCQGAFETFEFTAVGLTKGTMGGVAIG